MAASWLTEQDVRDYGSDLINVTQRAALHAFSPELQEIRNQNAELQRRLAQEQRHRLDRQVAAAVPDYQTIDQNPYWHRWLLTRDAYTGQVRQQLLNDAVASGDANRVVAFFRGFQNQATDQHPASARATSERARPSGNKPVYTRGQVKELYARHQRGEFANEVEWQRLEHDIIRAGAEGRILGGTDVAGK